jgi:hypothetical protein
MHPLPLALCPWPIDGVQFWQPPLAIAAPVSWLPHLTGRPLVSANHLAFNIRLPGVCGSRGVHREWSSDLCLTPDARDPSPGSGATGPTRALLHAPLNAPRRRCHLRSRCKSHPAADISALAIQHTALPDLTCTTAAAAAAGRTCHAHTVFALAAQSNNTALASLATHNTVQLNPRATLPSQHLAGPQKYPRGCQANKTWCPRVQ